MKEQIIWTGEKDDLTAKVGKYTLRVEQMNKRNWWYAVYLNGNEVDSGNAFPLSVAKYLAIESMKEQELKD